MKMVWGIERIRDRMQVVLIRVWGGKKNYARCGKVRYALRKTKQTEKGGEGQLENQNNTEDKREIRKKRGSLF